MPIELHPELVKSIDRDSARVAGSVADLTEMARQRGAVRRYPDQPIAAEIGPDEIIGEPVLTAVDVTGRVIAHFYPYGDKVLGLTGTALAEAQKIAERIWSRRKLQDCLSRKTVEGLLLDWVGATARGRPTDLLSSRIARAVEHGVKPLSVWVPIDELFVEAELPFGTATLMPLSRGMLDAALDTSGRTPPPELRAKIHRKWLGKAVMQFELTAEPQRAEEIALERADTYMALLQFYGAPATVLSVASHAAPTGSRPYRTQLALAYGADTFAHTEGLAETTYQLAITQQYRAEMEGKLSLTTLSSLAQVTACEYEEKLLEVLLIYGRACYQLDPTDKFLQVMTALEMFALRNDNEPISAALADRLAFAIAGDTKTRQEIARNLRDTYALRSGRAHHGRTISDVDTIEQFLRNAWAFFLTGVKGVGRYRSRIEFLDHLDRLKYGG